MDAKRKRFEAENFVRMGIDLYQRLSLEKAKRCFQKALDLDPDNALAKEYLEKMESCQDIDVENDRSLSEPPGVSKKKRPNLRRLRSHIDSTIDMRKADTPKSKRGTLESEELNLRKKLSKTPKSVNTLVLLAENLIKQKKYNEALITFDEIDELRSHIDRSHSKTRLEIVILADIFGNISQNPVYNPDYAPPEYMAAWILWADSALKQGNISDVNEICRQIINLNSNHEMAWYFLGLAQFYSGSTNESLSSFVKAADMGTGITYEPLNKQLTVVWGPDRNGRVRGLKTETEVTDSKIDVEAMVQRGMNLRLKNRNKEAEQVLREALRIEPNHMIAIRFLSMALVDQGRKKEERELYSTINSETWLKWAEYLERIGKLKDAEEAFEKSYKMDNSNKEAKSKFQELKKKRATKEKEHEPFKTGFDLVEEIRHLLKTTKIGKSKKARATESIPDEAKEFYQQGVNYETTEEYELSLNSHLRALRIYPLYAECWCALGPPLYRLGWTVEAEEVTKKALEIDDSIPKIWADYGALLLYLKRFDESEKILLKATELDPKSAYAWHNLGAVFSFKHRNKDAENAFRKAIQYDPNDAGAWLNLGSLLDELGRRAEAENAYREVLKLAPERAVHVAMVKQAAEINRRNRQRR